MTDSPEREQKQVTEYTEYKQATEYERTMAVMSSAASTKTTLSCNANGKALGCYDPQGDRIYLFPFVPHIPGTAIALEEAGHSKHREEYLAFRKAHEDWLQAVQEKVGPQLADFVQGWTQWIDDGRIYKDQLETFPGATELFRQVFLMRYKHYGTTLYEQATLEQKAAIEVYKDIAMRYLADDSFPSTFHGVLAAGYKYLDEWPARVKEERRKRDEQKGQEKGQDKGQDKKEEGEGQGQEQSTGGKEQSTGQDNGKQDQGKEQGQEKGTEQGTEQGQGQEQDSKGKGKGKAKPTKADIDKEAEKIPAITGTGAGSEAGLRGIVIVLGEDERSGLISQYLGAEEGLRNLISSTGWKKLDEVEVRE